MAQLEYTAEVKTGLTIELHVEAQELHLQPGERVRVQLHREAEEKSEVATSERTRVSVLGKYAFVPGGSGLFAEEKQNEIDLEDRER